MSSSEDPVAIRVERIPRAYEARELAQATAVPIDSQKNWRREKILPAHDGVGRVRTPVDDLVMINFLGIIAKSINDLRVAKAIAEAAVPDGIKILEELSGMVRFEDDNGSPWVPSVVELTAVMPRFHKWDQGSAFLFVPLPLVDYTTAAFLLKDASEISVKCSGYANGLLLNIRKVIEELATKLEGPVVTYRKTDVMKHDDPDRPETWHHFVIARLEDPLGSAETASP